ncbi:hypothetical protein ACN28C_12480 [Plantactinospora sp. WMMC1484]|uniref:hypothetical protein n=1 Tax=Plantactinospora sp. WMMC1484 TaxID=3404122 RepID=UPI003BF5D0AC
MELSALLLRLAAARPRVFLAPLPGATPIRIAAERELRERGWPSVDGPAQADILLVAGDAAELEATVRDTWATLPVPRALARATTPQLAEILDAARRSLGAPAAQRRQLAEQAERREMAHGGASMAERGPDRDGLELDRLHLALGPLLADWPAGLTLHVVLQGDVIQQVEVGIATGDGPRHGSWWTEPWRRVAAGEPVTVAEAARRRAAAHLDSLARLLGVAGWPDAATTARLLRDRTLAGASADGLRGPVHRFVRRVGGSRTLRWSTRGLGRLPAAGADASPPVVAGDVVDRYGRWLSRLVDDLDRLDAAGPLDPGEVEPARGPWDPDAPPPSATLVGLLPELLTGAEIATARLIVASLDPDLDEVVPAGDRSGHG